MNLFEKNTLRKQINKDVKSATKEVTKNVGRAVGKTLHSAADLSGNQEHLRKYRGLFRSTLTAEQKSLYESICDTEESFYGNNRTILDSPLIYRDLQKMRSALRVQLTDMQRLQLTKVNKLAAKSLRATGKAGKKGSLYGKLASNEINKRFK